MRKMIVASLGLLAACGGSADDATARNNVDAAPANGAAAGTPDGDGRRYALSGFETVSARGSDQVTIRVGPAFSVRATGPAAVLDRLRLRVDDGVLIVERERGFQWTGEGATVAVTMPTLAAAGTSGSGDMSIDQVSGGELSLSSAGSGDLTVGRAEVASVNVNIAGSGTIAVAGTAGAANVSVMGSGDFQGADLTAEQAQLSTMGSGEIAVRSDGTVNASSLGSGDIRVTGSPRCTVARWGSGEVRCG